MYRHLPVGDSYGFSKNYMRAETITRANARLVAAQGLIRLAQTWGGGDVATADGLRFVVPVRTLNAAHNPKYFGRAHGATFFNFANDQFAGQGGVVVQALPRMRPICWRVCSNSGPGRHLPKSSPTAGRTPTKCLVRFGSWGIGSVRAWPI